MGIRLPAGVVGMQIHPSSLRDRHRRCTRLVLQQKPKVQHIGCDAKIQAKGMNCVNTTNTSSALENKLNNQASQSGDG